MMMARSTRPRFGASGFTLVEILVALVVLAIMAVAAYGGLHAIMQVRERTRTSERQLQQLQLAMVTLTRDLEQAIARPIRHSSGELAPAMLGGNNDVPELAFTRSGRPDPLLLPRSSLERVAYTVANGSLVRYFYPVLDRTVEETPKRQSLLPEVESMQLRFLGQDGTWHLHWPPINAEAHQYDRRDPVAAEITLQTRRWGEIRRLIEIAP